MKFQQCLYLFPTKIDVLIGLCNIFEQQKIRNKLTSISAQIKELIVSSHSSMCVVSQCDLHPNHPWWCAVDPETNVCDWSYPFLSSVQDNFIGIFYTVYPSGLPCL